VEPAVGELESAVGELESAVGKPLLALSANTQFAGTQLIFILMIEHKKNGLRKAEAISNYRRQTEVTSGCRSNPL